MATKNKSGIQYSTNNNGSANGVQYANKIVTINDSDYFLLDAHTIDWNTSKLKHINPSLEYLVKTREEAVAEFFELSKAKNKDYPHYQSGEADHPLNRYRYYSNESPEYKADGKTLDSRPFWYYDNPDKCGTVRDSAELLDIIDFLAALANKAIKEVDMLKNQMDKDKAVLILDPIDIERMGGKIDGNFDVVSTPIEFRLAPNQTESRNVILSLYVYTVNNIPITDPALLYDTSKANYETNTCGLIYTAEPRYIDDTSAGNGAKTFITVGPNSSAETGVFKIAFNVTGWTPGRNVPNSKPSNIHLTKLPEWNNSDNFNEDYNFSKDDECEVVFKCSTHSTETHKASDERTVTFKLKKAPNVFEHIFICGEEYIYIDSSFFNGYENDAFFENYIKKTSKEHNTKIISLSYIIRRSVIPVVLGSFSPSTFKQYRDLLDSLIVVNNDFFDETKFDIPGLKITVNSNISIEVYPKYYGAKHIWTSGDIDQTHKLPGAYEQKDPNDGVGHLKYTGTNPYYYDKTALYNSDGLMAPLYCFDTVRSKYDHDYNVGNRITNKTFYNPPTNEYPNNVNVANQYVTRIIDGVERPGFKFVFNINANNSQVENLRYHNRWIEDPNNIEDGIKAIKPVFMDVIFGTTATKYVASNFLKIRFYLTVASQVYFIDKTKRFTTRNNDPEFANHEGLSNQCNAIQDIHINSNNLYNYYGLCDEPPMTSLMFTRSEITKESDEYIWNLKLPIFSYCSWITDNSNRTIENITKTIYPTYISPLIKNDSPKTNSLDAPLGPTCLSDAKFKYNVYNQYKFNSGLPSIPLCKTHNDVDYEYVDNMLLIKAVCLTDQNRILDITNEIEIDYAATYLASEKFISNLPSNLQDVITKNGDLLSNGKALCSYYCGIEEHNNIRYLTFIHPTISGKILAPSLKLGENFDEWEDKVAQYDETTIDKMLTIILKVPEKITSDSATSNHTSGKLKLIVNVDRAKKTFTGWTRRVDSENEKNVLSATILCGESINKTNIVNSTPFSTDNKHVVQTRNVSSDILISNGINTSGVCAYNPEGYYCGEGNKPLADVWEFLGRTEKIHKFNVSNKGSGSNITLYCKQSKNQFTIYRTQEFDSKQISPQDIKYIIDEPLSAKLEFLIDGDEWFKGYTLKSPDRLSLEVNLYNKHNNGIEYIGRTISDINTEYNFGSGNGGWKQSIAQSFKTTNNDGVDDGWYVHLNKSFTSFNDFKSSFESWELDLFKDNYSSKSDSDNKILGLTVASDGKNTRILENIYGDNWSQHVKFSITAGFKVNSSFTSLRFADVFNYVPTADTITQYIAKYGINGEWKLISDYGYNMMYDGTIARPIDDYFHIKIDNETKKPILTVTDEFKTLISNLKTKYGGDELMFGMNIAVMFPMTHIYKGKYFVFKFETKIDQPV